MATRPHKSRSACKPGQGVQLKANTKNKSKFKSQMPMCDYGAACRRKDCVYRHPKKSLIEENEDDTRPPCVAFLAGLCIYGKGCYQRHPPPEEVMELLNSYSRKACIHGASCYTEGCLYYHPPVPDQVISPPLDNSTLSADAPAFMMKADAPAFQPSFTFPLAAPAQEPQQGYPSIKPVDVSLSVPQRPPQTKWQLSGASAGTTTSSMMLSPGTKAGAPKTVKVPRKLWVNGFERDPSLFSIPDALDRFHAVNASNRAVNVLDLHFQSLKSFSVVLDELLYLRLEEHREDGVWVVTGTGHHGSKTATGSNTHQKRGGCLFTSVGDYLVANEYTFSIGKDDRGQSGCYLVTIC